MRMNTEKEEWEKPNAVCAFAADMSSHSNQRNGNIAVAITSGVYLIRGFSPELQRMFHRRF
jgi:hypothetical protein